MKAHYMVLAVIVVLTTLLYHNYSEADSILEKTNTCLSLSEFAGWIEHRHQYGEILELGLTPSDSFYSVSEGVHLNPVGITEQDKQEIIVSYTNEVYNTCMKEG